MVKLVGILNVTPDSFSDGGNFFAPAAALDHADRLFAEGADLVDVGAESTRPGAEPLTPEQEWRRLRGVLPYLIGRYPGRISLDTYHPETARRALELPDDDEEATGAPRVIINDVSGMNDPAMVAVVAEFSATCVVSNIPAAAKGRVAAAHDHELTEVQPIIDDLLAKESLLRAEGLQPDQIILDPGIGFGKTPELNRELLQFARKVPGHPVMVGYSRKRFLGEHRMEIEPNLEAAQTAILSGAAYLRVHDVAAHYKLLRQLGLSHRSESNV